MNDSDNVDLLNRQIKTWLNRAHMAYLQRNIELTKRALDRRWQFQKKLALILSTPEPPYPSEPDVFFKDFGFGGPSKGEPDSPSRIPLNPLPFAGAGAVALPEPESQDVDDQ